MKTANLGYPRIGPQRELKRAVEGYWRGKTSTDEMLDVARRLRRDQWLRQSAAGIDFVPSNDFALYDHVLDHVAMFGLIPEGYGWTGGAVTLDTTFALARGTDDVPALEMTKWFNTNYHYISARLDQPFTLTENRPLAAWREAQSCGVVTRPVLIGPLTFLLLANNPHGTPLPVLLDQLVPLYRQILAELAEAGAAWVQIDEPVLVTDLTSDQLDAARNAYTELVRGPRPAIMLQTYFDDVAPRWDVVAALPIEGIGLDFVHGPENLDALRANGLPDSVMLGAGIVDGRGVWRTDPDKALSTITELTSIVGSDRLILGPSCSLLHLPYTTAAEGAMDPTVRSWLAFAEERLDEVARLRLAAATNSTAGLGAWRRAITDRRADPRTEIPEVRARVAAVAGDDGRRAPRAEERLKLQQTLLQLPPLPTTTIGSFPQTAHVRKLRADFLSGAITPADYDTLLDDMFREVVALQEQLGLDVLVHGEFERSDMVDYFAQQLDGMSFIEGWVQSYGTRCVRPPVIFGDVRRPHPMTVNVLRRVAAMTSRPVKGMLTGPVTMLLWSFRRDDLPLPAIAEQLALAIRDEVVDLEAAGIPIIQIDEPAFREGLPLQRADRERYLEWATRTFRLSAGGVRPETQIHTHMCYSEFNDIMPAIAAMDADVISIENSRSAGELLEAFPGISYDKGIGPGVYDVHSERIPDAAEMAALIRRSARVIDPSVLWVNPDCGLKTRRPEEVEPALRNMVDAARLVRAELFATELEAV